MIDLLCVGVLTVDVFLRDVPRTLSPGDYVFLSDAQMHPGGTALNTAIDAARIGMSVAVIGRVGGDLAGELLRRVMADAGVDVSRVSTSPDAGTPSWYAITAPDGQEHYHYYGGTNATLTVGDVPDEVLRNCRVLHMSGSQHLPAMDGEPTGRLLERARGLGCTTTLDPTENTTPENKHLLQHALPHLDYFFASLDESLVVTEAESAETAAQSLADAGVGTPVIKMGAQGCLIASDHDLLRVPAYQVEQIDATGAGDAFVAGFLFGRSQGWSLERSARVGNAMGAMAVGGVGAITSATSRDDLFAFLDARDPSWRAA